MSRTLHENFCACCGELATKNVQDHLSVCALCFTLLNEAYEQGLLEDLSINSVLDECELQFMFRELVSE